MHARQSPHEAYRRVDFDARVQGAGPAELVHLCMEQLVTALGTAIHADSIGETVLRGRAVGRALTAVTALQMGVSGESGMARALGQLYAAARQTLLDNTTHFNVARMTALRSDFLEISAALHRA